MRLFDVLGPVMTGPSSSHTAGAVRIGLTARNLLGEAPKTAEILLHGSFAATGRGHGTDRALVAGLLGMLPDDERIPDSFSLAQQAGLDYTIGTVVLRDRKLLADEGMVVVVMTLSAENAQLISGPDIISRGFVYMKDNEDLMDAMKMIATHSLEVCHNRNISDWATIKSTIKGDLSQFLFKNTKRNPMILPVIMEI